jgi:Na+/melibiose symporter-like transporter
LSASLWAPFAIPAFRWQAISYAMMMAAVGAMTAATPYWVIGQGRGSEADVGVLLGLLLLTSIVCAPLWHRACRHWGEHLAHRAMLSAYLVIPFALAAALIADPRGAGLVIVYVGLGVAFSGLQVVPFMRLAHITRDASTAADVPIDGAITGCWTAMEKLGLATGPAMAALLLGWSGGQPGLGFGLGICVVVLLSGAAALLIDLVPRPRLLAETLA